MSVVAKFGVYQLGRTRRLQMNPADKEGRTSYSPQERQVITLRPYVSDEQNLENAKVWQGEPDGEIELVNLNAEAAGQFEFGKVYRVTFELVE